MGRLAISTGIFALMKSADIIVQTFGRFARPRFWEKPKSMPVPLDRSEYYCQWVDESVALANAATTNEARAQHYATADFYRQLAEFEANLTGRSPQSVARLN